MSTERNAEDAATQKIDPNATSSETVRDLEENESSSSAQSDATSGVTPSPDGQFDGGRTESGLDDPGPM
ncbi:MAG: hypothetical protein WKF30_10780 [Pyrinomonadaceae bacterium]